MGYEIKSLEDSLAGHVFEANGVIALKNYTTQVDGDRLTITSANNAALSILDCDVSEVVIDGVTYDNPVDAQNALRSITYNDLPIVVLTTEEKQKLILKVGENHPDAKKLFHCDGSVFEVSSINPTQNNLTLKVNNSYSKSILALCEITDTVNLKYNGFQGSVFYRRNNGNNSYNNGKIIISMLNFRYAKRALCSMLEIGGAYNTPKLCFFEYLGKTYAGLDISNGDDTGGNEYVLQGDYWGNTPFIIEYAKTNSTVISNSEINSSISYDESNFIFNENINFNQKNIVVNHRLHTTTNINSSTLLQGLSQNGRHVIFNNAGITNMTYTINSEVSTTYLKTDSGNIAFSSNMPITVNGVPGGSTILNGAGGSTATVTVFGGMVFLNTSNL